MSAFNLSENAIAELAEECKDALKDPSLDKLENIGEVRARFDSWIERTGACNSTDPLQRRLESDPLMGQWAPYTPTPILK